MKSRDLGNTGLSVSAVGLGGVPLSVPETRPDEAAAIKVIHRAVDQGVTFIDTADSYGRGETDMGHNERLFGRVLAQLPADVRDQLVVATKRALRAQATHGFPIVVQSICGVSAKHRSATSASNGSIFCSTTDPIPVSQLPKASVLLLAYGTKAKCGLWALVNTLSRNLTRRRPLPRLPARRISTR